MSESDAPQDKADEPSEALLRLREEHPDLYGQLLSANERIDRAGNTLGCLTTILWGVGLVTLIAGLVPHLFNVPIERFQSGWAYLVFSIVVLILWFTVEGVLEHRAYHALKPELADAIRRAGYTREALLTAIHGDDAVDDIAAELKADDDYDERRRY